MTCVELLGEDESRFLGGCWSGEIVMGKLRGGVRSFSSPVTMKPEEEEFHDEFEEFLIPNVSHTPVTALACTSDCVITGFNNGAVRFSRMSAGSAL